MAERKPELVEDWRWIVKRSASVRFAAVTFLLGPVLESLGVIAEVLSLAPPEIQGFVPFGIGLALFALYLALRLWKQNRD